MKICFVCCRPFQLLNTINYIESVLKGSENVHIDLFLDSKYRDQFYLEQTKYFDNIYYFSDYEKMSRMSKLTGYVFLHRWIRQRIHNVNIEQIKNYDTIVGTSFNSLFVRLCNLNSESKTVLLEDGIGTYMTDDFHLHQKSHFSRVMKLIGRGVLGLSISNLYCYHPDLICVEKTFPVTKLPLITSDIEKKARAVFGMERCAETINSRIIYFTADNTWERKFGFQEEFLYEMIYNYKRDTILRFHPNRELQSYRDIQVDDAKQLWEFRCAAISKNHILIGIFSTAQFSPYLFYGKHYNIIFLYKLVFPTDSYLYQQCEKTVDIMKKDFPDIYVPESREEFNSVMEELMSNK